MTREDNGPMDDPTPIIHLIPFGDSRRLPCCGRTDVPRGDRATAHLEVVTCPTVSKDPRKAFTVRDCYHLESVEVRSLDGELVARLCPDCGSQLPAQFPHGEEWR